MKSYLSLVPISSRIHKRQSRMVRICIILAVFLVTVLFSIADMWIAAEKDAMIQKHGNYHIRLMDVSKEEAERIGKSHEVDAAAWCDEINSETKKNYYANGKKTVIYGATASYISDIRNYKQEGSFPKNDREVMISSSAKKLLGVSVGDSITLNTPGGHFDFKVSGFCEDDEEFNHSFDGCCIYASMAAFQKIGSFNKKDVNLKYYIRFNEKVNIQKTIAGIKEKDPSMDGKIDENTAVLGLLGTSSNEYAKNIYPFVVICFLLILCAGVLMISGCINSNVVQRSCFFGMLRCIGASKKQIVRYVRLESFFWCLTSIPTGCFLGVTVNWILCAVLRMLVKGEWFYMPLFGVSVSGIICGAVMGIITVFIASHSPAKRAAKVSPVSAVSGNIETLKNTGKMANSSIFKIETTLGIRHGISDKKNLTLIAGSFALTIILLLSFSACLDLARRLIPSLSDFSSDFTISTQENTNTIDKTLVRKISEIPGVENVFGTMYAVKLPAKINGKETNIDMTSYEEFMLNRTKKSVASGDLSKVYGDSNYVLSIFSEVSSLDVGDKIKIGDQEIEIGCIASEGIGSISNSPLVVCSEETFARLTGDLGYMMVNIILDKNATESTVSQIRDLAGGYLLTDRRTEGREQYSFYWVIRLFVYGFLVIISMIAVLNIMNSISMSVSARVKQYGAMRAVGMESRQVTKMIAAEAATYVVLGMAVGDIFGLLLHYQFYEKAILTHFGGHWKVPVSALGVILLLVCVSCLIAIYAPSKRMENMAVTEMINEL